MIGKLICWITRKHKRGVRLMPSSMPADEFKGMDVFRCPRCGRLRKVKAKTA